jgi:thiol-disulfide isomerase/thioredoxin
MSSLAPYLHRKTIFLGSTAAVIGALVIAFFMWMVGPAAAREVDAACGGMRSAMPKPVLCGNAGESCSLPLTAPDFVAQDNNGKPVRLSQFRGKVVILNFWASWCSVCKSEKPSLAAITKDLAGEDFVVITLASDRSWANVLYSLMSSLAPGKLDPAFPADASLAQTLDAYKKALPEGTPFHVFLDPPASEDTQIGQIASQWGVAAVPESFIIDKHGRIRFYFDNLRDWNFGIAHTCLRSIVDE